MRAVLQKILSQAGYRTRAAESGTEALEILRNGSGEIDLAILDCEMPSLSGRATYDALRAAGVRTKVVFASGHTIETLGGLDPGADWAFLQKPLDSEALVGAVRRLLEPRRP